MMMKSSRESSTPVRLRGSHERLLSVMGGTGTGKSSVFTPAFDAISAVVNIGTFAVYQAGHRRGCSNRPRFDFGHAAH